MGKALRDSEDALLKKITVADELRQGFSLHLFHHLAPMHFDSGFTGIELCCNLLVKHCRTDERSASSRAMRNLLHSGLAAALIFFYSTKVLPSKARAFISL
jgi:hypothetical protein